MRYTLKAIGYTRSKKDPLVVGEYDTLANAIKDAEWIYNYAVDDYDKLECKITDEQGKLLFHKCK